MHGYYAFSVLFIEDIVMFRCTSCSYRSEAIIAVIKHLFTAHSVEPNFFFICGINGCLHAFKCGSSFSSFKTHASRKHLGWQDDLQNSHLSSPRLFALFSGPQPEEQTAQHSMTDDEEPGEQTAQPEEDQSITGDKQPGEQTVEDMTGDSCFGQSMSPETCSEHPCVEGPFSSNASSLISKSVNPERAAALFLLTLQEKLSVTSRN